VRNDDILSSFAEILEEITGVNAATITMEMILTNDLDMHPLSIVETTLLVEDKFGVKISDDQLAGLKTVANVVEYIAETR